VHALEQAAQGLARILEQPAAPLPDLPGLMAEILESEFGAFQIDWHETTLAVTTEPIAEHQGKNRKAPQDVALHSAAPLPTTSKTTVLLSYGKVKLFPECRKRA
jgi:hypothetical protein